MRKKEGFVTVCHTYDMLYRMNKICPHIIAKEGEKVVGYALCMHPKFANEIEVLEPMFTEIASLLSKASSYIVMGQICIARNYRKKGIFRKLYEAMKIFVGPEFSWIITEVDSKNTRSLNAHYAIGFTNLKTYRSGGQDWKLIALK